MREDSHDHKKCHWNKDISAFDGHEFIFWNLNKKKIIYSFVMMHFLWYMRQSFGMQQIFYKWYIFLKNSSSSYEYVNFGSAKNANCYPKPSNQCQIHGQIFTCNDRKTWKFQWHHHHFEVSFSFQNSLSITFYRNNNPCLAHSVSKVHFLYKNYKFLNSLKNGQFLYLFQNWLFLAVKNSKCIWIFAPKLVKNCHFMLLFGQF